MKRGTFMNHTIESSLMGTFQYDHLIKDYKLKKNRVIWSLNTTENNKSYNLLLKKAEAFYDNFNIINERLKHEIAKSMIDFKNDFWPEYDEDDENLDWDAVDAGEYNVSINTFKSKIDLLDIQINYNGIYLEYDDNNLFGGHRIHVNIDDDYKLINAEI